MNTRLLAASTAEFENTVSNLSPEETQALAGAIGIGLAVLLIGALLYLLMIIIADWKIFTKAGRPGWMAIIPVLNTYQEYSICWHGFFGILVLILTTVSYTIGSGDAEPASTAMAILGIIVSLTIITIRGVESYNLARAFGKSGLFAVGLFFLSPIFRLILAFGSARYLGNPTGTLVPRSA